MTTYTKKPDDPQAATARKRRKREEFTADVFGGFSSIAAHRIAQTLIFAVNFGQLFDTFLEDGETLRLTSRYLLYSINKKSENSYLL